MATGGRGGGGGGFPRRARGGHGIGANTSGEYKGRGECRRLERKTPGTTAFWSRFGGVVRGGLIPRGGDGVGIDQEPWGWQGGEDEPEGEAKRHPRRQSYGRVAIWGKSECGLEGAIMK